MEFRVFNDKFEVNSVIDNYESIIWTARFVECGDFELYTPVTYEMIDAMRVGYYFFCDEFYDPRKDIGMLMRIETVEISSDAEQGNKLKVTGRDLKSILDQRIVWGIKAFKSTDKLDEMITTLLNESIISPEDWSRTYQDSYSGTITVSVSGDDRKIDNFEMAPITGEWPILNADYQYNGETIYNIIVELMNRYNMGFDVLYDFANDKFIFYLKQMRYRTYDQTENSPIMFSPGFENLKNSNYIESSANERNTVLIIGEGDEYNLMYNVIDDGLKGLERKELGYSASDVTQSDDIGNYWGNKAYLAMLKAKGEEELLKTENSYNQTYEGTAETSRGYKYPEDFDVGDVVEIINEWGISSQVLVSEVVLSKSTSDSSVIPTFSTIMNSEEGGEE